MHESAAGFSLLESPAPGAALAPGRCVFAGWARAKPGRHFVDVRLRLDGRVFAGVHGYPRPDLAARFGAGRPILAGFKVSIDLPAGTHDVVLEALEIEGRWTPLQAVRCQVSGAAGAATPFTQAKPLRPHEFTRGLDFILRERLRRPDAPWTRLAAELAAEVPVDPDRLKPAEPFFGHADEPAVANRSRFGLLPAVGYLFHATEKIRQLWVTAELQTLQPLILGRPTANIAPQFPGKIHAAAAGYEGYADVPPQLPNPVVLRFYAGTETSGLQLVQVQAARRHDAEIEKAACRGTAEDFAAAAEAWRCALRVRGFGLIYDGAFQPAVDALRADYLRPAPAAVRPPGARAAPALRRAVLASHNLSREGAPLFLLDLARAYAAAGIGLTVASPSDGGLRARFEALGAKIVIVDAAPVFRARDAAEARAALAAIGTALDFAAFDLVVTNTFTAFWAVHAAKAAGARVLSYVHESTSPAAFYRHDIPAAALALVEEAIGLADAVSFTSDATRRHHTGPGVNAVLTPGWVDLRWIDGWLAEHPRASLRARFNLQPGELLVTNVGTVCDRKGQLGFARAVALFNGRHPGLAQRVRFVLLGGRQTWFDGFVGDSLAGLALPNLVVHPETPDFLGYYAAADLAVCSSLEESSPRVVLEAMACGTPLLASAIPGISEMARDGTEAALVAPGHTTEWAGALARVLNNLDEARARAQRARARVETGFAAAIVLPRHLALARAVAAGQSTP